MNKNNTQFSPTSEQNISITISSKARNSSTLLFSPIPISSLSDQVNVYAGLQRHLLNDRFQELLGVKRIIYLNELKKNHFFSELLCRDASKIIINLNCLKKSEFPFGPNQFPNGLFSDEICQIGKFAGISNNVQEIDLINFSEGPKMDSNQIQLIVELIWYIIEGVHHRIEEDLDDPTATQELIIESNHISESFILKKSKKSGRYWIKDLNDDIFYACSEEEYLKLKSDQIPDRIFKLLL